MPVVKVSKRGRERILKGHLWVYRSDVRAVSAVSSGEVVDVQNPQGGFLGRGLLQRFFSDCSPADHDQGRGRGRGLLEKKARRGAGAPGQPTAGDHRLSLGAWRGRRHPIVGRRSLRRLPVHSNTDRGNRPAERVFHSTLRGACRTRWHHGAKRPKGTRPRGTAPHQGRGLRRNTSLGLGSRGRHRATRGPARRPEDRPVLGPKREPGGGRKSRRGQSTRRLLLRRRVFSPPRGGRARACWRWIRRPKRWRGCESTPR